MDDEALLRRPPAPQPYAPHDIVLSVPTSAVQTTLSLLQRAGPRESGVFWYGPRDATGRGLVQAVIAPHQAMSRGNYHVSAAAMSAMVGLLTEESWKPLAQIHSHPGSGVEHSRYDDKMIASTRAVSIVFPFYGRWTGPWPHGIGIHECQNDYWHLLGPDHGAHRVQLTPEPHIMTEDLR
ncbi:MAG: hypothetical protein QOJ15_1053 [Bradyrhizobium sp.]|jgi:hypothetical protein|nr:hypothetical protein [Bradyrhizobium sp.]